MSEHKVQPNQGPTVSEPTAKEKMLKGSAWMTAGSIFSRVLGAIYIIPWYGWFGADKLQANALYTKGYTVYSLFIMIATAGIPSAVAKQVAYYNSLNEYQVGRRLFKKTMYLMFGLGLFSAALLWFISPLISQGDPRMVPIYRSLAVALILIPVMSLARGFFQGYQDMAPSAMSQLVEQFVRIVYMLAATYLIMRVFKGGYELGVVHSTLGAFFGAIGGLVLLGYYYLRHRRRFDELADSSANVVEVSDGKLIKEVIYQSIPFIFVSISMTLYNLLDQATFQPIMQWMTNFSLDSINAQYALFAGNANKLVMIIVSLAIAMASTAIPLLTEAVTSGDIAGTRDQVTDALELFFFVMLPCALGMAAVARPLYVLFYSYDHLGIFIMSVSAYTALALGLFSLMSAILQGVYENRMAIKYTIVGLIVKVVLQFPMTTLLHGYGPVLATGIGMGVSCYLMLRFINQKFGLELGRLLKSFNQMAVFALIMFVVVLLIVFVSGLFLNVQNRFFAVLVLLVAVGAGAFVYAGLALKTRVADKVLGSKAGSLRRVLRIK
ncbi:polysaccharide transport membrane protein [Ligilactobacillus salitolerans]|uniref:Polysaccharide transport membrane protein n=1 Tax=Ligilactobacillus salitolerans TaxID=1808352 RepID=A0A401ISM1_9LACO|nr:polysaccharide biosynthesis protein [Ligilactobacillus salitolerans]GBG94514.1 polysaccharide transport membrane protein [Ligilactobacillus salitolerans]